MFGMKEIRLNGRGGQGVVIASNILANAYFIDGKWVQAFPQFGVERRGSPVEAFLRVGEEDEHFIRSAIKNPDIVVILDPSLLSLSSVLSGLKEGGWCIINTHNQNVKDEVVFPKNINIAIVDANSIAVRYGLGTKEQPIVNSAILGGYAKAIGDVKLESLVRSIYEIVPIKKEENALALKEAYYNTLIL
jgi:2-oxoacid:acceptor oxidoreductase gamma subunit (pyruvate/2-ketoisovalerate family)